MVDFFTCTRASCVSPHKLQVDVVRWLLENGVDREKSCYYGQRPLDVVGQCLLDDQAASDITEALTEELKSEQVLRCTFLQKRRHSRP